MLVDAQLVILKDFAKRHIRSYTLSVRAGILYILIILNFTSCRHLAQEKKADFFYRHAGDKIGLHFKNELNPTIDFNILNYMYYYNGGGVGVGDFNGDGLEDLFFTNNERPDKLVLNKGNIQFEDITNASGIIDTSGWSTGVSVADINNDGWLDIYVGKIGEYLTKKGKNRLYINKGTNTQGIPLFEEEAEKYGLDLVGFSTQAIFFDYDGDGDLDCFQLNHSVHRNGTFGQRKTFDEKPHPLAGDKLLRNDDGFFRDVTIEAGIRNSAIGYGLGVVVVDVNLDGHPDLYIGNDFHENDYLYINQGNGTFQEELTSRLGHTSRFSMGVDAGDLNRDGFSEIFTLDMHPYDPIILKRSQGENPYSIFNFKLGYGYNHQYARNNLQLNRGDGTFSEIAPFANVYATDWSWSTLLFDFDNDGQRDIFVSNGIPKRINDLDYINFTADEDIQWKLKSNDLSLDELSLMEKMPEVKIPNQFFHNQGNLKFSNVSAAVSQNLPSYSNGSVYADLDLDGDLDLVVSNIDNYPSVYENISADSNKWLQVSPTMSKKNHFGIGTKLIAFSGSEFIIQENFPVRGFQSTVSGCMHLGLGMEGKIDSILLIWPDRSYTTIPLDSIGKRLQLEWEDGLPLFDYSRLKKQQYEGISVDIISIPGLDFVHRENSFVEFNREPLMPHMVSAEGPCLAKGDVNGDGLDDIYIGGAKWQSAGLYFQKKNGGFEKINLTDLSRDSLFEDTDALFLDVNNDGNLDLIVGSGGNEFRNGQEAQQPRLYLNNGKGLLQKLEGAFTGIYLTNACILPHDIDGDGAIDLFLGARAEPWNYGELPRSYLLKNDGRGNFIDVTEAYCQELKNPGLVTGGSWTDLNGDGKKDLVLSMEWAPITIFFAEGKKFNKASIANTEGWWNFILPADFDQDGDIDFIAGNLGLNSLFKANLEKPVRMYYADMDDNGKKEQIVTYYPDEEEILFADYAELTQQMPSIKKKYIYTAEFAAATIDEVFGSKDWRKQPYFKAVKFDHCYFENEGGLAPTFSIKPLPQTLQYAPLKAGIIDDFNRDGYPDLLLGGNYFENNIHLGRYDASSGVILLNDKGKFEDKNIKTLGITGQIRELLLFQQGNGKKIYLAGRNDESIKIISVSPTH